MLNIEYLKLKVECSEPRMGIAGQLKQVLLLSASGLVFNSNCQQLNSNYHQLSFLSINNQPLKIAVNCWAIAGNCCSQNPSACGQPAIAHVFVTAMVSNRSPFSAIRRINRRFTPQKPPFNFQKTPFYNPETAVLQTATGCLLRHMSNVSNIISS